MSAHLAATQHGPISSIPARPPATASPFRSNTVRQLYETFPTAAADIGVPASDEPCVPLIQKAIEAEAWSAGLSLCAYVVPRREAVWWGSQSLRRLHFDSPGVKALEAAEAWVRSPDEEHRQFALRVATGIEGSFPTTWIALAAARSSGSMLAPDLAPLPPGPEQTARSIRAAMLIALSRIPEALQAEMIAPCLAFGIELARETVQ